MHMYIIGEATLHQKPSKQNTKCKMYSVTNTKGQCYTPVRAIDWPLSIAEEMIPPSVVVIMVIP